MSQLRQFYYDDGKSRKRWHVRVAGKTQLVAFGRLGRSLKESKKTFRTADEAAEQSLKLVAAKRREGYVEIKPDSLEIKPHKGRKVATESQVAAFEKALGRKLPEEYRTFLKTRNGGVPNPACVQIPGDPSIDNVGVGEFFGLFGTEKTASSLAWAIANLAPMFPKGHLPIAGAADVFTLSLRKADFGCVHFWFHDTDELDDDENHLPSAGQLLAGSFDEFLTRVATMFGSPTESELEAGRQASPKKQGAAASPKELLRLVKHKHTPDVIAKIVKAIDAIGDLSGIADGQWPFVNLTEPKVLAPLLDAGLNPEIVDTDGNPLLWQCAGDGACVDLLTSRGVDLERKGGTEGRETALMRAIFVKSAPGVKRLLAAGANPTAKMPWWITRELGRVSEIAKLVEAAKKKWKGKRAGKR